MAAEVVGTIAKGDRTEWVARLVAEVEVVAPVAVEGGDVAFAPVRSGDEVLWEFENPLLPPKTFVLPQTEPLLRIRCTDGHHRLEPVGDGVPRVLFNLRSCDVKGVGFLRRMFAGDPADEAWLRRADRTTVISLACETPCSQGFCICSDAGPFLASGFDVQLTDLGDRLLAEVGSEKGRACLETAGPLLRPVQPDDVVRRRALEERAKQSFGPETCHFGSAMRRISNGRVRAALWEAMGDWCLECGACNFLCPTCYCFSVADRREDGGFVRCRLWDSCQLPAFTLEASGHNPRERRAERVKRRFFHKVSAQYYRRDEEVGCVGCGRCVKACLGTTDMPAVVAAIRKGRWDG